MFFGVGALIIPLVTRPFLLPFQRDEDQIIQGRSININITSSATKLPFGGFTPDDVTIQYPYLINGIFLCLVSIGFIVFYFKDKQIPSNDCKSVNNTVSGNIDSPGCSNAASGDNGSSQDNVDKPWKKYVAIIPMMLIANIAFGFTTTVGSLGPSFAVKSPIAMTKKTAALLITVFWTMFCFYRIIFIPLSSYFSHRRLMLFNLLLILISVGLMISKAAYDPYFTWASFILLGTGYSPTFSVSFALLQQYFPISGRLASFIFMNGCIGESIHPWLVAKFMEGWPEFFVYYLGGMCIVYVILNFSLPHLCNLIFKRRTTNQ
ncbi:uncharacterized protein LOC107359292 [Tetranychus urticae]|nr:uncharacterized protein LOC107359292 [Tetranychus urticae]